MNLFDGPSSSLSPILLDGANESWISSTKDDGDDYFGSRRIQTKYKRTYIGQKPVEVHNDGSNKCNPCHTL